MDEALENMPDSDVLLIIVLFGEKKANSTPAGASLCGIQEGAFQLIKGSGMIMQHFVWSIYSGTPCSQQTVYHQWFWVST